MWFSIGKEVINWQRRRKIVHEVINWQLAILGQTTSGNFWYTIGHYIGYYITVWWIYLLNCLSALFVAALFQWKRTCQPVPGQLHWKCIQCLCVPPCDNVTYKSRRAYQQDIVIKQESHDAFHIRAGPQVIIVHVAIAIIFVLTTWSCHSSKWTVGDMDVKTSDTISKYRITTISIYCIIVKPYDIVVLNYDIVSNITTQTYDILCIT